jgi:hypothetical protein
MQLPDRCHKKSPWWCWLVLGVAACVVLPGAARVGGSARQSDRNDDFAVDPTSQRPVEGNFDPGKSHNDRSRQFGAVSERPEQEPVASLDPTGDRAAPADKAVSAAVPGDPATPVKSTDDDAPTTEQVLRALPGSNFNQPFITAINRENVSVVTEKIVDTLDEPRFFPMVGTARLQRRQFKCTVSSKKTIRSVWPVPFNRTEDVIEVVYIDRDHLVRDNPDGTTTKIAASPGDAEPQAALRFGRLHLFGDRFHVESRTSHDTTPPMRHMRFAGQSGVEIAAPDERHVFRIAAGRLTFLLPESSVDDRLVEPLVVTSEKSAIRIDLFRDGVALMQIKCESLEYLSAGFGHASGNPSGRDRFVLKGQVALAQPNLSAQADEMQLVTSAGKQPTESAIEMKLSGNVHVESRQATNRTSLAADQVLISLGKGLRIEAGSGPTFSRIELEGDGSQ